MDIRELDGERLIESAELGDDIVAILARLADRRGAVRRILERIAESALEERETALTELMIPATDTPGAKAAQVNRYMDLLLNDGPVEPREAFLAGLSWLDGAALKQHRKPFVKCSDSEQVKMLEAMDDAGDSEPGGRFFRQLKQLTTSIYYSTQIGTAELNKGGRIPPSFGCKHPEHA